MRALATPGDLPEGSLRGIISARGLGTDAYFQRTLVR